MAGPDDIQPGESIEDWVARTAGSASTNTASAPAPKTTKYTDPQLRLRWRAGVITEDEWRQALIAGGKSPAAADQQIASGKNTGVSTAKSTAGQLTAGEAGDVEATRQLALKEEQARRATIPQNGEVDSYENPSRAAIGLSSVSDATDPTFLKNNPALAAGGSKLGAGSGTGSGSGTTAAAKKLPLTPEEAFLQKQADKVAAQQLAARMQRQAEDQYILDSGGSVQRNPATGGLESTTKDSSGKYSAIIPHEYDASTGQITPGQAAGWKNSAFDQGNSLNPEGTWWQNASPETNEALRRMNANQLGGQIGRDPSATDLLSPAGGTGALGGGDPTYERNIGILRATGKVMPSMTNGPGDPVAGSVNQVINKFGPAGGGRVNLLYPDATGTKLINPDVMTQQEQHNYEVTGSTSPGPAELGGRTMGELETQQAYGSDPAPQAARAAVASALNSGRIFDFDQLMKQNGAKMQALGAVDVAGLDQASTTLPKMADDDWLSRNSDTSAILANRGVRGGESAYGWNSDDGVNYGWQQGDTRRLQQGTTSQTTQPDWHDYATTPGNNFAPGIGGLDFSRAWNGLITSAGKRPAGVNKYNESYFGDYPATVRYANGGTSMAGNPFSFGMYYPQMAAGIPNWMRGNLADYIGSQYRANGPGGWYNTGATPTNTPTSWAPSPVSHAEGGTDVSTAGPTGLVDLQTGQMKGVYGEAGPEAAVMVPLSRPAKPGLPSMVQSLMGGMGTQTGNTATSDTLTSGGGASTRTPSPPVPLPSPVAMLRQQAKLLRPRVRISVGG